MKSPPPDFGSALFGLLLDLGGNEVRFYRHLRSELPVDAPRVDHAEGDSLGYVLLLEDLTDRAGFRTLVDGCSDAEALRVVESLAALHARYHESPRFDADLAWVKRFETNRDAALLDLVRRLSIPVALRRYGHRIPDEIRAAVPQILDAYPGLEPRWAEGPRTLIHGDAHLGNLYFRDGRPGFFDWQVTQLGQGMRDVTYFLIHSLGVEQRRENEQRLVRAYLAALADGGVRLDFDTAWKQYRLQSVYAWIASVVTAPSRFQPEEIVAAGLTRSCRALLDLDAPGAIAEAGRTP